MIHATNIENGDAGWQSILRTSVRSTDELQQLLKLEDCQVEWIQRSNFPLHIPRTFIERMEKGNPNDPLLLQVAPRRAELIAHNAYTKDPLLESEFTSPDGVIQKYANRALIITTQACPVHCRYCFRRHFDYNAQRSIDFQNTLKKLADDPSIVEVILSGGDPLTLTDTKLNSLIQRLESVDHIKILRIHTRFPVMIPQRVTPALVEILAATRLKVVVVVHINHPNEIDESVRLAVRQLRHAQIDVFNQSVLLRDINDSVQVLSALMNRTFEIGVIPYYLHLFDPIANAHHFDVPEKQALLLWRALQAQLPGYLVPRLVRELPHEKAKTVRS